jgi:hypothetical protein
MAACIFSFLSIRTKKAIGESYEGIAGISYAV